MEVWIKMWLPRHLHRAGVSVASLIVSAMGAVATASASNTAALKKLSLEDLSDIPVYSASRRLESTQTVPSAIFVLTQEDLRRSHVTTVPDALRLVPGVQVGKVDANKYAVSMRGFNSREANKLLVLVDGRTIYDPLFAGMLWESQDFLLEDIDRIEVIRGPGGTLWGANAFNGVINIITRNAGETQGGFASVTAGNEERYTAAARYGWQMGEEQAARVYVKSYERDTGFSSLAPPYDASRMTRGGFRWDWDRAGDEGVSDGLRISGDIFEANTGIREDPTLVQDVEHRGRNVMARWNRQLSDSNGLQVQVYYDHVSYESFGFDQKRTTYDIELQQNLRFMERHNLVWGGGFRSMRDHTASGLAGFVDVLPLRRNDEITTYFAQDTFSIVPDRLNLTAGLKYERTDYADSAWLPNLRLAYMPSSDQTWWVSAAKATRVPSRLESDLTFFGVIRPGDGFGAEEVRAYELGHRRLVSSQLWFDVAVFFNDYDHLRTSEGIAVRNLMYGDTRGAELAVRWEPTTSWRLDAAYTHLDMNLSLEPQSVSNPGQLAFTEGLAAKHQVSLRAAIDLPRDFAIDATARYVGELESLGFPAYTQLDLSVSWLPTESFEISATGMNLLDSHQPEQDFAYSASGMYTENQRSVYARAIWRF
jgi:iron complex outermembrane recepter protein